MKPLRRWLAFAGIAASLAGSLSCKAAGQSPAQRPAPPAWLAAIAAGDGAAARRLLEQTGSVDPATASRVTPLMAAIYHHDEPLAAWLVARGADVNARETRYGWTPLLLSLRDARHAALSGLLLDRGARVDTADLAGETPLLAALRRPRNETLALKILARNPPLDAADRDGDSALHVAIASGNIRVAAHLLARGANIDARDRTGGTVLHRAIREKQGPAIRWLLSLGLPVNVLDRERNLPLHLAFQAQLPTDLVWQLLTRGADVKGQNHDGVSPLMLALEYGYEPAIISWLVTRRAPLDARDRNGWTPLHYAIRFGYIDLTYQESRNASRHIRILLDRGADPQARSAAGLTPLALAVAKSNEELVKLLRARGARD